MAQQVASQQHNRVVAQAIFASPTNSPLTPITPMAPIPTLVVVAPGALALPIRDNRLQRGVVEKFWK